MDRALAGCLLGGAVGDALGLPYEGLGPGRARRLLGPPDRYRLFLGRGWVSDDTDHACITAAALIGAPDDPARFARRLAWQLRLWLLTLPAGIGLATLKSVSRLWLGWPPDRSGVWSAGNGPAMRSPVLGVALGARPAALQAFVRVSTRMTHADPRALHGALAVALAAHTSATARTVDPPVYLAALAALLDGQGAGELLALIDRACASAARGEPSAGFAAAIGSRRGISGYMLHTVPCVVQTWLRHGDDFRGGLQEIIGAGGDTDTTAAILGGILGARCGVAGIPAAWLDRLAEWPRTRRWMAQLGGNLALRLQGDATVRVPRWCWPGLLLRSPAMLAIVLAHGFRRLAPPYGHALSASTCGSR